jgi:hypothetical protein
VAALDGHLPEQIGHRAVDDLEHAGSGLGDVHIERVRHVLRHRRPGGLDVQLAATAQEVLGTEIP